MIFDEDMCVDIREIYIYTYLCELKMIESEF